MSAEHDEAPAVSAARGSKEQEHTPHDAASFCSIGEVAVIRPGDLTELPMQIDAAIQDVKGHASGMVDAAERAGQLLLQAKATVPHGEWDNWLREHCAVAPRTAQAYMRLCAKLADLPTEMRNAVADLPLREAMKAIMTAPSTPPRTSSDWLYVRPCNEAERMINALRSSAEAIQRSTRDIEAHQKIKRSKIERIRARLQAAIAELDKLLAAEQDGVTA